MESSGLAQERVQIPSGEIVLEGVLVTPDGPGRPPGVVVCHPHPRYGGAMSNNVVMAVCVALSEVGIATLRFNFRGVGGSGGLHGDGIGEQEDALAAVDYLAKVPGIDAQRLGLAGYSFGAQVGLLASVREERVHAVAAISPPVGSSYDGLTALDQPKLFLLGSSDSLIPGDALSSLVLQLPEPKEFAVIPGADHFWVGYERVMAARVARFFVERLSG